MHVLKYRKLSNDYYKATVHLDTSQVDEDLNPLPAYVYDVYVEPWPGTGTEADYVADQLATTVTSRCTHRLAEIVVTEGSALPGEGTDL